MTGWRGATFQEDTESQYLHLQRQGRMAQTSRNMVLHDFDPLGGMVNSRADAPAVTPENMIESEAVIYTPHA